MALAAALLALPARAQDGGGSGLHWPRLDGLAAEARAGASVGNYAGAASDLSLAPGPAFALSVSYAVTERVGVYGGFSRGGFGCDTGFCAGRTVRFASTGVDAGVELRLPYRAAPWIRAGLVRHTLRYDAGGLDEGEGEGKAARGTGFSAGGGVRLPAGRRLSLTPGVRYVRYGAADGDGVAMLVGDVGLEIRM